MTIPDEGNSPSHFVSHRHTGGNLESMPRTKRDAAEAFGQQLPALGVPGLHRTFSARKQGPFEMVHLWPFIGYIYIRT